MNRNNPVARLLHVPGNVKSRTIGIIGKPRHGDGLGFFQDGANGLRLVQCIPRHEGLDA